MVARMVRREGGRDFKRQGKAAHLKERKMAPVW
jgi:hypothetical protein